MYTSDYRKSEAYLKKVALEQAIKELELKMMADPHFKEQRIQHTQTKTKEVQGEAPP